MVTSQWFRVVTYNMEEVFSVTLALELASLGVVSEALEMTWSLLEVIRAHRR